MKKSKGEPPPRLEVLVPRYLSQVLTTGVAAHPELRYSNDSWTEPNRWELTVSTRLLFGFDLMLYLPCENYPVNGYGGRLERMGDWAYVHE